jgi:mono/diheme cytochrome c family protein
MKHSTAWMAAMGALALMTAVRPAAAQDMDAGKAVFTRTCMVCHQEGGRGQDGLAPPLTANPGRYAGTEAGRKLLANVALYGMIGDIESGGKHYNSNMPSFKGLSDDDLANVLSYVALELSAATKPGDARPISAQEVRAQRNQSLSPPEVRRQRAEFVKEAGL